MGMEKTISFFCQPERKLGSAAFLGGIGVLLMGYPFFGMIIEVYGFVALFGGFFPMAISFLRQVYFKVISFKEIYMFIFNLISMYYKLYYIFNERYKLILTGAGSDSCSEGSKVKKKYIRHLAVTRYNNPDKFGLITIYITQPFTLQCTLLLPFIISYIILHTNQIF